MAVTKKSVVLSKISYANLQREFADNQNKIVELANILATHQSTGVLRFEGVEAIVDTVVQPLLVNATTGITGTVIEAQLNNWVFYFSAIKSIVTVISGKIELTGDKGFIYVTEDGELLITSASYSTYQPDRVRVLYFSKNQSGTVSIIIMPELAATPRYLRSISLNQKLLQVVDFNLQVNNATTLKRFSTRALIEGAGSLSILDENILVIPDETPVRFVLENSINEFTTYPVGAAEEKYATDQLWLSLDGRLVIQPSGNEYTSMEEAINESSFEFYPAINGDSLGEFIPVARVSYKKGAVNLTNTSEFYILNLIKVFEPSQGLVWYTK